MKWSTARRPDWFSVIDCRHFCGLFRLLRVDQGFGAMSDYTFFPKVVGERATLTAHWQKVLTERRCWPWKWICITPAGPTANDIGCICSMNVSSVKANKFFSQCCWGACKLFDCTQIWVTWMLAIADDCLLSSFCLLVMTTDVVVVVAACHGR